MILWRKSIGNTPQLQRILSPAQYQQLQASASRTSINLKTRSETTMPANKSSFCLSRRPHEDEQHNLIGRPASRLALFLYDLGPMAEWNAMDCEPRLQRAHERAARILDEVGEAIIRNGLVPMPQNALRVVVGDAFCRRRRRPHHGRTSTWCRSVISRRSCADSRIARHTSSVAIAHLPSCSGDRRCTIAS